MKRTLGLGPAIVILSLCVIALCLQATAQLQASSRFVWALARDQAIPFSKYFYALNKHRLPVAATWLVLAMALPMAAVIWTAPHITSSVLSTAAGTFCMVSYVSYDATPAFPQPVLMRYSLPISRHRHCCTCFPGMTLLTNTALVGVCDG